MIALPPYALTPPTFRFRALVALAERLPLGGDREMVLATFVGARLLWDWRGPGALDLPTTESRAHGARHWLQAQSLPAATRALFQQLTDAVARNDVPAAVAAWERALGMVARLVNGASRAEFKVLSTRLRADA